MSTWKVNIINPPLPETPVEILLVDGSKQFAKAVPEGFVNRYRWLHLHHDVVEWRQVAFYSELKR